MLGIISWWSPSFIIHPVTKASQIILFPFERFFSYTAFEVRESIGFLSSIGELKRANERLTRENLDLLSEVASLQEMQSENETLRRDFDVAPRSQYRVVSAEVIALDELSQGESLLINQGSGAGIVIGMPVIVGKGILIGKISEVFVGSARVSLLSNAESTVAVTTPGGTAKGIIRGEHGLGILFDLVPRTDVFKRGESVVTSGLGGGFPRGLLVGTLQDPEPTADKLFQQAPVIPPVKYGDIRFVSIIVSEKT